jgi:hypothetical protein
MSKLPRQISDLRGAFYGLLNKIDRALRSRWTWIHVCVFAALTSLSLYRFLVTPGLVIFQNWTWPIGPAAPTSFTAVYDPYIITNSGLDASGYTRTLTNWPVFVLSGYINSTTFLERLYVVFAYAVEYVLALIAANLLLRVLRTPRKSPKANWLGLLVVVLFFCNPAALQWESGLLIPFFWGAPLLLAISLAGVLSFREGGYEYALLAGIGVGVAATLDPRFVVWAIGLWLASAAVYLLCGARFTKVAAATIVAGAVALPGVLLTLFAYNWVGGSAGSSVRGSTISSLTTFSSNATLPRTFELLGYYITGIYYSPPSILSQASPGTLPSVGSPAYMLVPGDFLSSAWAVSLVVLPVLAFAVLLFKRFRPLSIFMVVIALVSLSSATGTNAPFSPIASAEVAIGQLPLGELSTIWQTTIGVPIYVQDVTEAMYVPMIALAIVGLWEIVHKLEVSHFTEIQSGQKPRWTLRGRRLRRDLRSRVVVTLVVGLLLFSSWQFFSGDFYPGGYSPGVSENGASPIGALEPTSLPTSDIKVFNFLESQTNLGRVFWPGPNSYSYPWNQKWSANISTNSPLPLANVAGFSYLIANNLTGDVAPLLRAYGVSFVVIDNLSIGGLELDYGVASISTVVNFLTQASGITLLRAYPPSTWLFGVLPISSLIAVAPQAAFPTPSTPVLAPIVGALSGLGVNVALGAAGSMAIPLTSGATSDLVSTAQPSIHVLGASGLYPQLFVNTVSAFDTPLAAPHSITVNHTGEFDTPYPDSNWTLSVWSLSNEALGLDFPTSGVAILNHSGGPSTASLNYLSSLINGRTRGIPVDPTSQLFFHASAEVRVTNGGSAGFYLNAVGSNTSAINVAQVSSVTEPLNNTWQSVSISGTMPLGTAYFTIRTFFTNLVGEVQEQNVSIQWNELTPDPASFGGATASIINATLSLPLDWSGPTETLAVDLEGNAVVVVNSTGQSTTQQINSSTVVWHLFPEIPASDNTRITVSGEIRLAGIVTLPSAVSVPSANPLSTFTASGAYRYSGHYQIAQPGFLTLQYEYTGNWQLVLDNGAVLHPLKGLLGNLIFQIPEGNHTYELEIMDYSSLPLFIAAVGLVYALLVLVAVWPPIVRWARITSARVRRGAVRKSSGHFSDEKGDSP